MSTTAAISRLYLDHGELKTYLETEGQPSFAAAVENTFPKALLLAIASYFEDEVKATVSQFCAECSDNHPLVLSFITNKAIQRQYHTYFDWDAHNANAFFSLFGPDFKEFMRDQVNEDDQLDQAIRAFLQVGNLRNSLLHSNFATFTLNLTSAEIHDLYLSANRFVAGLLGKLRECSDRISTR